MVRDEKDDRLLPHQIRRPKIDERREIRNNIMQQRGKLFRQKERNSMPIQKMSKTRHENFGILPNVITTSLRPDTYLEEHVSSDMLRLRSQGKSQRKVVRKDPLHC